MKASLPGSDYHLYPNRYIDATEESDNYFLPVWKDIAADIRDRRIVDIGCGSGRYTACLVADYSCRVAGIDGNAYALKKAMARGFYEVHEVADLSMDTLPLGNSTYDFAVNKDVLEHLIDPLHLLREIHRILITGGKLLLHVPNHFPLTGRIRFLFNNNIDPLGFCLGAKTWENPHIRFFRYEDIAAMLSLCGFRILKNLSYHFPAIPWLYRLPVKLQSSVLHYLTGTYTSQFCCGFTVLAGKEETPDGGEAAA